MALQTIRIGSAEDIFQYDDATFDAAIETAAPIKAGTPVAANDVLRVDDIGGGGGLGNVQGPGASTDNAVARFNGVGGKIIQNSTVIANDADGLNIPTGEGYKVNGTQVVTDQQAVEGNVTSGAITDPADAPADADALRDDLVANAIAEIGANFTALDTKINNLLAKLRTHGLIDT